MKPTVDKIKAVFKGDEQYMILSTYYRQNHYHPVYALRNSFGLLIQVPFFIAAYTYLSHLEAIRGISFLFIQDMSAPDSMLRIGNLSINMLPIAMTLINCAAGALYTQGFPVKDKVPIFGMAALFLILLYNSPSGLVLFWTMNNIFSLVKNIFYKLKDPLRVLYILMSCCMLIFIGYLVWINTGIFKKRLALILMCSLVLFIPFFLRFIRYILRTFLAPLSDNQARRNVLFLTSITLVAVLTGICIPSSIIASSPEEFSMIDQYTSPFPFMFHSFLQAGGLCVFWPLCIYFLFNNKIKTLLAAFFPTIALWMLIDTFIFQGNYGMISNTFLFDMPDILAVSKTITLINTVCLLLVPILFLFLSKKLNGITSFMGILLVSLTVFSAYNIVRISSGYHKFLEKSGEEVHTLSPVFSLARDKPNVIVLMADRAINGYVEPIFEEHPRLLEQFDGFTLYPNTLSFAGHTLMGVPPVWGGYEYTPLEMNKRDAVSNVEKHNEALLVLPRLFTDAGFHVTVTDPSWANYSWIPDTSIYKPLAHVTALHTIKQYTNIWYMRNNFGSGDITSTKIKRNALWFSLLKVVPPALRMMIYDDGLYWSPEDIGESIASFINSYAVLDFLPELTASDSEVPSVLLLTNDVTHDPVYLQYPDYIPVERVTDKGAGEFSNNKDYHINSALYLKFGIWLDALKTKGVYDNTRIIIVSDHGAGNRLESYNPVLLVKDFNAHGALKRDMTFMTNADVPVLAVKDIISDPVNPFTGKPLTNEAKKDGVYVTTNGVSMAFRHPKNLFKIDKDQWIFVRSNIFDPENWNSGHTQE
jgi:hypothetical protein